MMERCKKCRYRHICNNEKDMYREKPTNGDAIRAADVVEEENILKFYYVRSIDEYWIGQRIDNFYYAEYDPKNRQWVWTHSRYLPWGKHIVAPDTLWKEHTYPSEPEEMPFGEWLTGFIKKHIAVEARQELDEAYKKLPAKDADVPGKWISVEERLPEESKGLNWYEDRIIRFTSVWCCDVNTGTIAVRNRLQGKKTGIEYLDQHTKDTDWHWSQAWWEPTHWMPIVPLPELPRKEFADGT